MWLRRATLHRRPDSLGFGLSISKCAAMRRCYSQLKHPSEKETISRLLYNIGSKREVEQYLRQFCALDSQKFAVIKVGGAVLTDELETLASSLTFLYRVGLYPIVVHGAGPQLNQLLESAGIEPNYADGIRVTDAKTLAIARQCFHSENLKLVEALESMGTRARPVIGGLFQAEYLQQDKFGLVGRITGVNKAPIESSIRSGALPIVTSLAETASGQILNVNADTAAGELAKTLQPLKVVFLNSTGGMFHPTTNQKMDVIEIERDYEALVEELSKMPKKGTLLKLMEIKQLLDTLPVTTSVSITDAQHLSRELFTDGGAGTLIRRGYNWIWSHQCNITDMNQIKTRSEYCMTEEDLSGTMSKAGGAVSVLVDSGNEIGAVLTPDCQEIPRLRWFSATHSALLYNMADSLWEQLTSQHPEFYWIVDRSDPLRSWYFEKSDGSHSFDDKTLFWCGNISVKNIQSIVVENSAVSPVAADATKSAAQKRSYHTSIRRWNWQSTRQFSSKSTQKRVGLIGARGHTGQELVALIDKHPGMELAYISSRELNGQPLTLPVSKSTINYSNLSPKQCADLGNDVDCWIMALPNAVCKPWVEEISKSATDSVIVDLSADYRFDKNWTYGLPELGKRSMLKDAKRISNPGCYATGMQLALFPLIDSGRLKQASVFGVSGYSGAGTKPSNKNDPMFLADNIVPYSLVGHMHEREVNHQLGKIGSFENIQFMPHVAPFFRGITLTVNVQLNQGLEKAELMQLYKQYYDAEPMVDVVTEKGGAGADGVPLVRDNAQHHGVRVGGIQVQPDLNRAVVVVTLDNLLKGAATQAMQNMNLALGFPETTSILE